MLIGLSAASPPVIAKAQVMEIDDRGEVTTYDRPAVFRADGVRPITPLTEPHRPTALARTTDPDLEAAATAARLSPSLVAAVAWTESRFRHNAVSAKGAIGEMQLLPSTARNLGVDPFDSQQNLRGGATYLSALMQRYDGDLIKALAAYNAGPGAVDRWGGRAAQS